MCRLSPNLEAELAICRETREARDGAIDARLDALMHVGPKNGLGEQYVAGRMHRDRAGQQAPQLRFFSRAD
jgi:hypothetical protein